MMTENSLSIKPRYKETVKEVKEMFLLEVIKLIQDNIVAVMNQTTYSCRISRQ